jgi:hypothetical protein
LNAGYVSQTLVVRGDNEQKTPKLALVKDLDNTTKPTFTERKVEKPGHA